MNTSESYRILLEQAIEIIDHEVLIPNYKTKEKLEEIKSKYRQTKEIEESIRMSKLNCMIQEILWKEREGEE